MIRQWYRQWADDGSVERVSENDVRRSLSGNYKNVKEVMDCLEEKQKVRNLGSFMWFEYEQ